MRNNIFFVALGHIRTLLTAEHRKLGLLIVGLSVISAAVDVAGLAALVPVVSLALEPELVQQNEIANALYTKFGFTEPYAFILALAIALVLVFVIKNAFAVWVTYKQQQFSFRVATFLSSRQYSYYYERGYPFIKVQNSADVIHNIVNIPQYFASNYLAQALIVLTELSVAIIIAGVMLALYPMLIFYILIAVLPAVWLTYLVINGRLKKMGEAINEWMPKGYSHIKDGTSGFVDVILNNRTPQFLERHEKIQQHINTNQGTATTLRQTPIRVIETSVALGVAVIIAFIYFKGTATTELTFILGIFAASAFRLMPSINKMMYAFLAFKNYEYVIQILLKSKDVSTEPQVSKTSLAFEDKMQLNQIAYSYDNHKALSDISFEIKKGQSIGIVGESGSGKSTLLNIILRFLIEDSGTMEVDGKVLSDDLNRAFQQKIGYVQQEIFIKNKTVAENVAFGTNIESIDLEKVKDCLSKAKMSDVVAQFPKGINHILSEGGTNLSGGQKQRLGIARALYKGAEILILDEATSALDAETEEEITQLVKSLSEDRITVIVVAHRPSTLKYMDRIMKLEKGMVVSDS